ncbi:MAG TPA: hypothetical protein VJN95_04915 [Gemmatimonadales bacterium]|nr:hypothetical protein [Gemmatimonadales bacterium]
MKTIYTPFVALVALAACNGYTAPSNPTNPGPTHTTYSAIGDSTTVAAKVAEFRLALGGALNGAGPSAATGRREINWDGVPAAVTNVDNFPLDFFNVNSTRGAVYLTPGTGVRVDSLAFATINPDLAAQFKPFSGKKLFMAVGSNKVETDFKVVGTGTPGLVQGFGVVFSDVDRANSAKVAFLDATGTTLLTLSAPAEAGAQKFSFIGAVFETPIVAKVQITSGEIALSPTAEDLSAGGTRDLVVMDDFIFGEPHLQ